MHWTFLQVLITTSTTTTIIIKLSKCVVWHPTRGLLRFYLPGNSIIEIVQKATGIQKSGDETFRYSKSIFLQAATDVMQGGDSLFTLVIQMQHIQGCYSVMGQLDSSWNQ